MALITVIGSSGRQGMAQVKQALAAGYDVRAISRQPEPFAGAKIEGIESVEVRPMDLYDTTSFKPALEGSDYIFYTHPLQARADRAVLIGDLGKVAAELDVKRVVWNTSSWIPDKPGDAFTYAIRMPRIWRRTGSAWMTWRSSCSPALSDLTWKEPG